MWARHDHFKEKLACGRVFRSWGYLFEAIFFIHDLWLSKFLFDFFCNHESPQFHLNSSGSSKTRVSHHSFCIRLSFHENSIDSLRRPAYVLLSFRSYVNSDRFERWLMQLPHIGQYNDHFCILSGNEIIGFVMSQCRKMSFGNRAMHSSMWASWSACWWDNYKQFEDEMKYELSINAGDFLSASHTEI